MSFNINKLLSLAFSLVLLISSTFAIAHSGPLNKLAIKECTNKVKSQMCQYEGGHNDLYIGTCQYMADDLMCVRNQPIKMLNKADEKQETHHHSHENK